MCDFSLVWRINKTKNIERYFFREKKRKQRVKDKETHFGQL